MAKTWELTHIRTDGVKVLVGTYPQRKQAIEHANETYIPSLSKQSVAISEPWERGDDGVIRLALTEFGHLEIQGTEA